MTNAVLNPDTPPALRVQPPTTPLHEALTFLRQVHAEQHLPGLDARLQDVTKEIHVTGTWTPTTAELAYGCHLAWRNSTRCVGRSYWKYLDVRDLRHVSQPDEVFTALVTHLHDAFNGGNIRPTISVFHPGVRILNDQLIRYAGYREADGTVLGDARNVDLTDLALALGWAPAQRTRFDVLPVIIRSPSGVRWFELPRSAVQEVRIVHPDFAWFEDLGLKWHALPVISDMRLEIGGLDFTCAPFNGWYLQTEIAARNLADADRYDQLPLIARGMGLDTSRSRSLWLDRALVELNVAVLHSFDAAGVKISDHHAVTRHFVQFETRERQAGRVPYGRWSWLIPPLSPAATPVYHRQYEDAVVNPNFYPSERSWVSALREGRRCPFH